MSSTPARVVKPSSILLLSPSLELARAFLLRFFAHCALQPPADVSTLSWAAQARWLISNKYYDAEVSFVLRQVVDEGAQDGSDAVEEAEMDDVDEDAMQEGYPAVLVLLSAAALQAPGPYRVPGQIRQALANEKPDVSLAFSLSEEDTAPAAVAEQSSEEREGALAQTFLDLGVEYISTAPSSNPSLPGVEGDDDHTPPPYEQVVQSLSSHMWPSMALKSKSGVNAEPPRASPHDTMSALVGLLGGLGGFSLPSESDARDDTESDRWATSDFSDDDDERALDQGYAQLDDADDGDGFGDFASSGDAGLASLDGEHRQAGLEFMSALASSSVEGEVTTGSPNDARAGWTNFDATSTHAHLTPAPARSDSLLESFGPSDPSALAPLDSSGVAPERKFSSSFAPPAPVLSPAPRATVLQNGDNEDPTEDLGAMLGHLNSLRTELAGVDDHDERRRRAAEAVMALFGDDFDDGEDEMP